MTFRCSEVYAATLSIFYHSLLTMSLNKTLTNYQFILCSGSPRRLDILQQIGLKPIVCKSDFEENLDKSIYAGNPKGYVKETSYLKLVDVLEHLEDKESSKILLSADTVVVCGDKILEKPGCFDANVEMLKTLRDYQARGEKIYILTCCTLCKYVKGEEPVIVKYDSSTDIRLVDGITDAQIIDYATTGEGQEVAGGFKIQGLGAILFDRISGDYYNCVGLPASQTYFEIARLLESK